MKDDKIQGILFSQTELIDLRNYTIQQKAIKAMLAKKHSIKNWSDRYHKELRHALKSEARHNDGSELKKVYVSDARDLSDRLRAGARHDLGY